MARTVARKRAEGACDSRSPAANYVDPGRSTPLSSGMSKQQIMPGGMVGLFVAFFSGVLVMVIIGLQEDHINGLIHEKNELCYEENRRLQEEGRLSAEVTARLQTVLSTLTEEMGSLRLDLGHEQTESLRAREGLGLCTDKVSHLETHVRRAQEEGSRLRAEIVSFKKCTAELER